MVTKASLDDLAPATFKAWRFGLAAVVLLVARPDRVRALARIECRRGLVLGLLLGSGFLLQTVGLSTTAAGLSGFLTGISVVLTPVLGWPGEPPVEGGGFPLEAATTITADRVASRGSFADWGPSGLRRSNALMTLAVLDVLRHSPAS